MVNNRESAGPCSGGLTAACFERFPAFARRAFAYRLLHTITPKPLARKLPEIFRKALLAEGVTLPGGYDLPPGAVIPPGTELPIEPPPVGELPGGSYPPPAGELPPGTIGAVPPIYVPPWAPGPVDVPGKDKVSYPAGGTVEIAGELKDGSMGRSHSTWSTARDSASAGAILTGQTKSILFRGSKIALNYDIYRYFCYFDLSAVIPAGVTVKAVSLWMAGTGLGDGKTACVQEGTQAGTLTTAEYQEFTGTPFSNIVWQSGVDPAYDLNEFVFSAAGIAYIQSIIAGTALLCVREYDHDYSNSAPVGANQCNGYLALSSGEQRPRLIVTY